MCLYKIFQNNGYLAIRQKLANMMCLMTVYHVIFMRKMYKWSYPRLLVKKKANELCLIFELHGFKVLKYF